MRHASSKKGESGLRHRGPYVNGRLVCRGQLVQAYQSILAPFFIRTASSHSLLACAQSRWAEREKGKCGRRPEESQRCKTTNDRVVPSTSSTPRAFPRTETERTNRPSQSSWNYGYLGLLGAFCLVRTTDFPIRIHGFSPFKWYPIIRPPSCTWGSCALFGGWLSKAMPLGHDARCRQREQDRKSSASKTRHLTSSTTGGSTN